LFYLFSKTFFKSYYYVMRAFLSVQLLQDTSKPAKGKRGGEPTIVIVFFSIEQLLTEKVL
jgi:hypothetical protein